MERDDRITTLLLADVPPLTDEEVAAGRAAVSRRVTAARRQQWVLRGAAAVAAAALVGLTVLLWPAPSQTRLPTVTPSPAPQPTTPVEDATPQDADAPEPSVDAGPCVPVRGGGADPALIDELAADRTSIVEGGCVLPGRLGPTPGFDTSVLGVEQEVDGTPPTGPDPIPTVDDVPDAGLRGELLRGAPAIHLGDGGFLTWRTDPRTLLPVICIAGDCFSPSELDEISGPLSMSGGARAFVVTVWTPPGAAAVALEFDGEPMAWTRPVARTALLWAEVPRDPETQVTLRPDTVTVRILDADGQVLDEATEGFPF
jgi:hypothetical protein